MISRWQLGRSIVTSDYYVENEHTRTGDFADLDQEMPL